MTTGRFQLLTIHLGDSAGAWEALGFDVRRDAGASVRLAGTTVALGTAPQGAPAWSVQDLAGPVEGIGALEPVRAGSGPATQEHPNGIVSIDHVVVSTGDIERTAALLEDSGLERRGGRTTNSYGSPMEQRFYWLGDVILELVGPPGQDAATDEPARIFGLALVSADLERTLAHLGELAGSAKDAVQPGRRIAGIRGDRVGVSLPLAVMSPHPD
ncbi:MAG: hypothetical protein R2716_03430 [Microthrixaceae bacterium]